MNIIGNKMFAYIDNHGELTQSMVNQYNESLIFLGDEKQIFVPIINAYVGIGQTAYNNLLARIGQNDDQLLEYNKYIHNDTVTSIYVQFSPEEIETARNGQTLSLRNETIGGRSRSETVFKANKNIVLKGFDDYNLPGGLDELGRSVQTSNTSGITVNIEHNYDVNHPIYTGQYTFKTSDGVTHSYSYTYYSAYDVITIDDTKTWSYIKASNTYLSDFAMKFATDQANRVYKNLLGVSDGSGNVFIEKEFQEAFNYSDVTNILTVFEDVFVKMGNAENTFQKVTVENNNGGYVIKVKDDNNNDVIIYTNDPTQTPASNDDLKELLAGKENAGLYGGYITKTINSVEHVIPVWYHRDNSSTASSNTNIADGIQTLKEVAYILDRITDGAGDDDADDGIQLAFNIGWNHDEIIKLKEWQNNIGSYSVSSFKSESNNDLLTVNYYSTNFWDHDGSNDEGAIGHVKLDIDLKLAQTYVLDGVTYAAYLENHQVPDGYGTYFAYTGDPSDLSNYYQLTSDDYDKYIKLYKKVNNIIGNTFDIPLYERVLDPSDNTKTIAYKLYDTVSSDSITGSNHKDHYVFIPYKEHNYVFSEGLTDVKWVTTYVSYVNTYLNDRINNLNVSSQIDTIIKTLDYDDTDQSSQGLFVAKVDETDGKISVTHQKLPLDIILKNDVYYTNDIYIHAANSILKSNRNNIYTLVNGVYTKVNQSDSWWNGLAEDNFQEEYYLKTSLASMTPVPTTATVGDMILNGANVTYFWKQVTNGYTEYLPLDIQTAYTTGTLFNEDKPAAADSIYYWAGTSNQIKYFDVSTLQRANGSTATLFTSYITYLAASSSTNSGLADSWDVRRTIESMFQWVNIKTNKIIG
jgi:hypothetical protein